MTTEPTSRGKRRYDMHHPLFIVSAVVVGLGLAALLYFLLFRPADDPGTGAAPATTAQCGNLPTSEATGLQGTPDASWRAVGDIAVPVHPKHGPATIEDGLLSCYAVSPEGAVFAAVNIVAMGSTGQMHTVLTDYAAPSPAREAMLAETPVDEEASSGGAEFVGFNLRDYSTEDATVEVAFGIDGQPPYGAYTIELVRHDGDWKLDVPSSGEIPYTVADDLTGFTEMRAD